MRYVTLVCLLFSTLHCNSWGRFWEVSPAEPERSWYSYIGGPGLDNAQNVRQAADGGYYTLSLSQAAFTNLGGKTPLNSYTGLSDFFITKLAKDGELQWYTFFGTTADDWTHDLVPAADGGVLALGYTAGISSSIAGVAPIYQAVSGSYGLVAKFNANGGVDWWTYFGGGGAQLRGAAATSDGGFIVVGFSNANFTNTSCTTPLVAHSGSQFDVFVAKLSSTGVTQWCTFLGGSANDYGIQVQQAVDGGYFVGAHFDANTGTLAGVSPLSSLSTFQGSQDMAMLKLTAGGSLSWWGYFGSVGADNLADFEVTADGGLVIAGMFGGNPGSIGSFTYTGSYGGGDDALIIKMNSAGAIEWYRLYGSTGNDGLNGVAVSTDGGFLVSGRIGANITSLYSLSPRRLYNAADDILLMRTDSAGTLQWYSFYGGTGTDGGAGIAQAKDGGFIFSGTAAQEITDISTTAPLLPYNAGNETIVIKLKSDGGF